MNREKVVFGFFIVLALTLNFGFFIGEIENPEHHSIIELFFVIVVNLIATVLKLGDRSQIGAVLLATALALWAWQRRLLAVPSGGAAEPS